MELTPEERQRIYEEEKARLEAEERAKKESARESGGTTGLEPNVAGLLCYLGVWVTGIIFLVLEQKNKFVRFHAAQSIIVFGSLSILSTALGFMPVAGPFIRAGLGILGFILWLTLMVKAYHGDFYRLPVAAELADWLLNTIASGGTVQNTSSQGVPQVVTPRENRDVISPRTGEIVGSAVAIAFNIAAYIFFNFFHDYIAFYTEHNGVWTREPLLTSAYNTWLPVVNVAIALTILGHVVLIISHQKIVRETVHIMLDIFALITIGSLLSIFPFDFSVLPVSPALIAWSVRLSLGIVMIVVGIAVLVRFVKLVLNIVKS